MYLCLRLIFQWSIFFCRSPPSLLRLTFANLKWPCERLVPQNKHGRTLHCLNTRQQQMSSCILELKTTTKAYVPTPREKAAHRSICEGIKQYNPTEMAASKILLIDLICATCCHLAGIWAKWPEVKHSIAELPWPVTAGLTEQRIHTLVIPLTMSNTN